MTTQLTQVGASTQAASTTSQALAELTSIDIGSAIGGQAGASTAMVVDTNNRQLHQTEIDWIKRNAKQYAKQLNSGNEPTLAQIKVAEDALAQQAFRQVQFGVSGTWDTQASAFLDNAQGVLAPDANFPNSGYTTLFYASPAERANAAIYLNSAINNVSFYQQHQLAQPTVTQIQTAVQQYAVAHKNDVTKTLAAIALPPSLILGAVASAPAVSAAVTNYINTAIAACTGNLVLCVNQAAIEASGLIEGAPITATLATGATAKAVQEIKVAADELKAAVIEVKSAADALRLRTTLAFQEANILTSDAKLTVQAVQSSTPIRLAGTGTINNPSVVQELTSDGSKITDWGKYTTQSVSMPNGQSMQLHYYMNSVTKKIDYVTQDYKVKGVVQP